MRARFRVVPEAYSSSEFDDDDGELTSFELDPDVEGEEAGVGSGSAGALRVGVVPCKFLPAAAAAAARVDCGSATPMAAARPRGRCVLGAAARAACCLCWKSA